MLNGTLQLSGSAQAAGGIILISLAWDIFNPPDDSNVRLSQELLLWLFSALSLASVFTLAFPISSSSREKAR